MLDFQDEVGRQRLAAAITQLKCEIDFPASWKEFFKESGLAPGDSNEKRRFPRWKNPTLAGLFCSATFPVLPRAERWHPIYLKDVSQGGVSLIHCEQLYPLERVRLLFIDDVSSQLFRNCCLRTAQVSWCRHVQAKCYEVGVYFVDN